MIECRGLGCEHWAWVQELNSLAFSINNLVLFHQHINAALYIIPHYIILIL